MGSPNSSRPRLLKVILPSTFFRNLMLRRAPNLRSFQAREKVFIRPSLTKEERDRRRTQMLLNRVPRSVVRDSSVIDAPTKINSENANMFTTPRSSRFVSSQENH
ncbi:hypothetical protein Y032_0022g645 [Ancylostoma ceylanicum]|uniref:Uncharacterized protein n=1 Tax=Ancylostoma ceylanicum TaxID=53326 RepID=A0A016UZR0_9BILA|nr:hypothetical protein Y032_0022g645 [Ancylostoma ceylanicum]